MAKEIDVENLTERTTIVLTGKHLAWAVGILISVIISIFSSGIKLGYTAYVNTNDKLNSIDEKVETVGDKVLFIEGQLKSVAAPNQIRSIQPVTGYNTPPPQIQPN